MTKMTKTINSYILAINKHKKEKRGKEMPSKLYNNTCDILDEAREIAADASVTMDQAIQAMKIAQLMEIEKALVSIMESIDYIGCNI